MYNMNNLYIVIIFIYRFTGIIFYLDRGFTQTFQCLELEKHRDRTKRFEVSRIVEVNSLLPYAFKLV
jgi:hypothetical protein